MCRLEDQIRSGTVPDKELYESVLELTGSEDVAAEAYTARIKAKVHSGTRVDI